MKVFYLADIKAMVISGGVGYSSEVISPVGEASCTLPDLPEIRLYHTHDKSLICGGNGMTSTVMLTCLNLTSSGWIYSHNLTHMRTAHSSWAIDDGVILMGGIYSPTNSEIAKWDGTSEQLFDMNYFTG